MCVYRDAQFDLLIDVNAAWTSPLLPAADELAHRYSSEQPLPHWVFYVALAYFKSAIIAAAGIDFRSRMGGSDDTVDQVGEAVAPLIAAGLRMKT